MKQVTHRHYSTANFCRVGHDLRDAGVRGYTASNGRYFCRTCQSMRMQKSYQEKRERLLAQRQVKAGKFNWKAAKECPYGHALTGENKLCQRHGTGSYYCRECRRNSSSKSSRPNTVDLGMSPPEVERYLGLQLELERASTSWERAEIRALMASYAHPRSAAASPFPFHAASSARPGGGARLSSDRLDR